MTLLEALRKVREIVAHGWIQGITHCDVAGVECYCLSAAIDLTATGRENVCLVEDPSPDQLHLRLLLLQAISDEMDLDVEKPFAQNIINWNDRGGRTQAEVVALVDKAIAKAEAA